MEKGVKWVAVPNRSTRSAERKKKEHSRWFQESATLAYGMRGTHQRVKATAWPESLPLSRSGRNETLGGIRSHGGHAD